MSAAKSRRRHRCAVFGCPRTVGWRFLMCPKHWALVPRALQVAVYREWNDRLRTAKYDDAVKAAVASLEQQGELFPAVARAARRLVSMLVVAAVALSSSSCGQIPTWPGKPKAKKCAENVLEFRADSLPDSLIVRRCPS